MAFKTILISMSIIFLFGFYGEPIMASLGISIEALRVSGGLLLFYTAFNMVTSKKTAGPGVDNVNDDISVFPMSIPLISGPGCLTLTILLFSKTESAVDVIAVSTGILLVLLMTLITLVFSSLVKRVMGITANDIIARLLGVLLAALAIQFIADGIRDIISRG
jgi:multiple antibiotic resistance protein